MIYILGFTAAYVGCSWLHSCQEVIESINNINFDGYLFYFDITFIKERDQITDGVVISSFSSRVRRELPVALLHHTFAF